jgi:RNA polymerase sigma-70 factor (ECF subfamily)
MTCILPEVSWPFKARTKRPYLNHALVKNNLLSYAWYSATFKRDQKTRGAEKKADSGSKATVRNQLAIPMEEKQSIFEELCLPHLDAAYNLARWLVGRDEDAQDVVQDAYVRALKGFKGFRGDNARAWLLAIVRNAAYTWLKKHAKQSHTVPFDPAVHATTTGKPLCGASHEERVKQFDEALNRLPVEMREILLLREIEGWSYKQLASTLNLPPDAVMSCLRRARQRLQQELAEVGPKELSDEL